MIIVSTHLLEEIDRTADASMLYMSEGEISFYGGADELDRSVEKLTVDAEKGQ